MPAHIMLGAAVIANPAPRTQTQSAFSGQGKPRAAAKSYIPAAASDIRTNGILAPNAECNGFVPRKPARHQQRRGRPLRQKSRSNFRRCDNAAFNAKPSQAPTCEYAPYIRSVPEQIQHRQSRVRGKAPYFRSESRRPCTFLFNIANRPACLHGPALFQPRPFPPQASCIAEHSALVHWGESGYCQKLRTSCICNHRIRQREYLHARTTAQGL